MWQFFTSAQRDYYYVNRCKNEPQLRGNLCCCWAVTGCWWKSYPSSPSSCDCFWNWAASPLTLMKESGGVWRGKSSLITLKSQPSPFVAMIAPRGLCAPRVISPSRRLFLHWIEYLTEHQANTALAYHPHTIHTSYPWAKVQEPTSTNV